MELKNVNFESLETVRRKCITFAKDGNTIVKPYKTLYNVEQITGKAEHKTLYFEVVEGKETWEEASYGMKNTALFQKKRSREQKKQK